MFLCPPLSRSFTRSVVQLPTLAITSRYFGQYRYLIDFPSRTCDVMLTFASVFVHIFQHCIPDFTFLRKWRLPDQKWMKNGRHIYKIRFSFFQPFCQNLNSKLAKSANRTPNIFGKKMRYVYLCRWFRFAQLAKGKKFRPQ